MNAPNTGSVACAYVLQVGLFLESAEPLATRPDDLRLSNQDRTRASPLLKATDLGARTLDDGRYLLLALAFRQRCIASQYRSMERRTFTVLPMPLDISPNAYHRSASGCGGDSDATARGSTCASDMCTSTGAPLDVVLG